VIDWRQYSEVHGRDNTVTGHVLVWPELYSAGLRRHSEILVYLPPSLAPDGPGWTDGRRYPTLYFNDGQNVFDERTAKYGEWHADETLEMLAGEGLEAIAVAVPNGPSRMDEYNPWRGPSIHDPRREVGGRGHLYLEWLVGSVMPLIDRSFPTSAEREATGIIGSSMGGLISLYALMWEPRAFGFAGVMSPSVRWNDYGVVRLIEDGRLPPGARVHLDMGGQEWPGAVDDARRLRDVLVSAGLHEGHDLQYVEDDAGGHDERAWSWRLPDALRFLLAPFVS
jgi:predicted alpha/beta superfamily hydrolase